MRKITTLSAILTVLGLLCSGGGDAAMTNGFDTLDDVRVIKGKAALERTENGRNGSSALSISNPEDYGVEVALGDTFLVETGCSYVVHAWMCPDRMRQWYGELVLQWLDTQGAPAGELVAPWVYTASSVPHHWKPMPATWMEFSATEETPMGAVRAQALIRFRNNRGDSTDESGRLLIDRLSVSRTPVINITTGEPGNLVVEPDPLPVILRVSNVPQEMPSATLRGTVCDLWDNVVGSFEEEVGPDGLEKDLAFNGLSRGYYEIRWELATGSAYDRHGAVSGGIVPDPGMNTAGYDSPFALDAGFSWFYVQRGDDILATATEMVRRAGLKHLRERMHPLETNPERGVFEWGKYEKAAKAQHEAGIRILETIHSWPKWLSMDPSSSATPPRNLTGVYEFFKQGAQDLGTYIPYWESWNEADIFFFKGRPEEFAGLQKAAYLGARAGNPNVQITSTSSSGGSGKWFERTLENGTKDYFDILATHYYGDVARVGHRLQRDYEVNEKYGVVQPYWMTEMGMSCYWDETGTYQASEIAQAAYLVKSFAYVFAAGVERFHLFYMAEFLESNQDLWGICRYDLTPKPAFIALANMIGVLDKAGYLGRLDLDREDVTAYVFDTGRELVVVAWAESPVSVSIGKTAVDMVGKPCSVDAIGPNPIFIFGAEINEESLEDRPTPRATYTRPDTKPLSLIQMIRGEVEDDFPFGDNKRKHAIEVKQGQPLDVHLTLCNFWDDSVTVTSEWRLPEGWKCEDGHQESFDLAPWEEKEVMRRIMPMDGETGEHAIRVHSTAPGRTIAPVVMHVRCKKESP